MNHFSDNLSALRSAHRNIAHLLSTITPHERYTIERTSVGLPTVSWNGIYLHSRYDPAREAQRLISAILADSDNQSRASLYIVYAFGLGYVCDALLRTVGQEAQIVIVLADLALFHVALATRDVTHILRDSRVHILFRPTGNDIARYAQRMARGHYVEVIMRSLMERHRQYFQSIERAVQSMRERAIGNQATTAKFASLWARNILRNMDAIAHGVDLSFLRACCRDTVALIIGGGPSLNWIAEQARSISKDAFVICVDTALRAAHNMNIQPDLVVSADPQVWNSHHLTHTVEFDCPLVVDLSTHPAAIRSTCQPPILVASAVPVSALFQDACHIRPSVGAGGSVITMAWEVAYWLGCSTIYLAGADFGFPGMRTHYRGAYFEERMHTYSSRLNTAEGSIYTYLNYLPHYTATDYRQRPLMSNASLMQYGQWLENRAGAAHGCTTYTLCEYSMRLRGIAYCSPSDIHISADNREHIRAFQDIVHTHRTAHDAPHRLQAMMHTVESIQRHLYRIKEWIANNISLTQGKERTIRMLCDYVTKMHTSPAMRETLLFILQIEQCRTTDISDLRAHWNMAIDRYAHARMVINEKYGTRTTS